MNFLSYLLYPLGLLYATIVAFLRWKARRHNKTKNVVPILVVGNLSVGGTGKTPMVRYLLQKLVDKVNLGVISRGYGRKTKGLYWVESDSASITVGDEPLELKRSFKNIPFLVVEKRKRGIEALLKEKPATQLIILDDALQHWAVKADYNILLTTYQNPFFKDFPLPAGRLREFRTGYKRAQSIIVTKCPMELSEEARAAFIQKIKPLSSQKVFFSSIEYLEPYWLFDIEGALPSLEKGASWLLLTGIANNQPLTAYLKEKGLKLEIMSFPDHHQFREKDWEKIQETCQRMNCSILTTEKDASRLFAFRASAEAAKLSIAVLPIQIQILFGQEDAFWIDIQEKVLPEIIKS